VVANDWRRLCGEVGDDATDPSLGAARYRDGLARQAMNAATAGGRVRRREPGGRGPGDLFLPSSTMPAPYRMGTPGPPDPEGRGQGPAHLAPGGARPLTNTSFMESPA
jgi:hypothetical protein